MVFFCTDKICSVQVSLLSMISPRNFVSSTLLMGFPSIQMGGNCQAGKTVNQDKEMIVLGKSNRGSISGGGGVGEVKGGGLDGIGVTTRGRHCNDRKWGHEGMRGRGAWGTGDCHQ